MADYNDLSSSQAYQENVVWPALRVIAERTTPDEFHGTTVDDLTELVADVEKHAKGES